MDIIGKLAKNVIDTKYESLPKGAIEATKRNILDTLGVLIAGASDCDREVGLVREWGGKEESTILVYGGKVPGANAAWVNGIMARVWDFDDSMVGALHVSASTVPTALAASEVRGEVSGKEFITAIISGADLATRIHLASKNYGFSTTGTIMVFGTAAIAAKILRLDMDGMLNALGIAFLRAAGSHQVATDKVLALRLMQGFVCRSGIEAAILAQRGFTGVKNVLQGTYGFFRLFSRGEGDLDALTAQLGKRFEGVRALVKKYASCGTTHAATEAALRLAHEVDIDSKEISRITVKVSEFVHSISGHRFTIGRNPRVEAQFSLPYAVANAIVRKSSMLRHFTERYIQDPEIVALAHKVHPIISTKGEDLSALVEIEMRDARKYSKSINYSEAFLHRPLSTEEVKEKFRNCVAFMPEPLTEGNCESIIDMVDRLEEINDISKLIKFLTLPRKEG
jgi:2-methylcitrate dehydratase PrpD